MLYKCKIYIHYFGAKRQIICKFNLHLTQYYHFLPFFSFEILFNFSLNLLILAIICR